MKKMNEAGSNVTLYETTHEAYKSFLMFVKIFCYYLFLSIKLTFLKVYEGPQNVNLWQQIDLTAPICEDMASPENALRNDQM